MISVNCEIKCLRAAKLVIGLSFLLFFICGQPVHAAQLSPPATFAPFQYRVEDLTANLFDNGQLLVIEGKIRNLSQQTVAGEVIVYLKNSGDEVIHAVRTEVNRSLPISRGNSGAFEISTNISSLPPVGNVTVEFLPIAQRLTP